MNTQRLRATVLVLLATAMVAVSQTALATDFRTQAVSGFPWIPRRAIPLPGQTFWVPTVRTESTMRAYSRIWNVSDGQVCLNRYLQDTGTWVTPVNLDRTSRDYVGEQYTVTPLNASSQRGEVSSRLVSFNPNGTVSRASAASTGQSIGSAWVPANGTLFVQSAFKGYIDGFATKQCLATVRVR